MIRLLCLFLVINALATGCGSRQPAVAPDDVALRRDVRAGRLALSIERPEQAATQYQSALNHARARDDVDAIGDYGYDLAVAQLSANHPAQALTTARATEMDLARREKAPFPALILVQAVALYRLNNKTEADALAARVEKGPDPAVAKRASFLRGLIADETDDPQGLNAALARLAQPASPEEQADQAELMARRDIRQRSFDTAAAEAGRAADLRRTALDYRGMARALAVEANARKDEGRARDAADLFMRAGQSAAAQGDVQPARLWLRQALELAQAPAERDAARQALAALANASTGR